MTSKTAEVIRTFQKSSRVLLKSDFSFPKDLVKKVDPIEVLSILASKIPAPMNDAFVEALRMANKFDVGDDVTHLLDSLDHDAHAPVQPARAPAQLSAPPHLPGSTGDEDAGQVREKEDAWRHRMGLQSLTLSAAHSEAANETSPATGQPEFVLPEALSPNPPALPAE